MRQMRAVNVPSRKVAAGVFLSPKGIKSDLPFSSPFLRKKGSQSDPINNCSRMSDRIRFFPTRIAGYRPASIV